MNSFLKKILLFVSYRNYLWFVYVYCLCLCSYYCSATFKWLSIWICIVRSNHLKLSISQIYVASQNLTILVISTTYNNIVSQYLYINDTEACFVGNYNKNRTFLNNVLPPLIIEKPNVRLKHFYHSLYLGYYLSVSTWY